MPVWVVGWVVGCINMKIYHTQPPAQLKLELGLSLASVGPLLNETKCHLVSFSLLTNQTK